MSTIQLKRLAENVAAHYKVNEADIKGRKLYEKHMSARVMFCYLAHILNYASLEDIAKYLGKNTREASFRYVKKGVFWNHTYKHFKEDVAVLTLKENNPNFEKIINTLLKMTPQHKLPELIEVVKEWRNQYLPMAVSKTTCNCAKPDYNNGRTHCCTCGYRLKYFNIS